MFVLRREHEAALDADFYDRFKKRAMADLRRLHPEYLAGIDDRWLRAGVDRASETSRSYGLRTERQMIRFMRAALLLDDDLGPRSRHRDLIAILAAPSSDADTKSQQLLELAQQRAVPPAK